MLGKKAIALWVVTALLLAVTGCGASPSAPLPEQERPLPAPEVEAREPEKPQEQGEETPTNGTTLPDDPEKEPSEDGPEEPPMEPEIDGGKTATITFETTPYTVGIGEIGTDDDGNTTVGVVSPGIGTTLPFRNGSWAVPVQAKIVCGGTTYGWQMVTTDTDALIFSFDTDQQPETIILYPFGGADDEGLFVYFDAETKSPLEE